MPRPAMQPIHLAARDGDLAKLNRLIEEDGRWLNEQVQPGSFYLGCTPLMLASLRGHDAVVARLIGLGADVGLRSGNGRQAVHWACRNDKVSCLALLLGAGGALSARCARGETPLITAAYFNAGDCVALLLARRGGEALAINAQHSEGKTALHLALTNIRNGPSIVQPLLDAGADPTMRDNVGRTPLDEARQRNNKTCVPLLETTVTASHCARLLLKARALLDAAVAVPAAAQDAQDKGASAAEQLQASLAAAPAYLKGRVEEGQQLPRVFVNDDAGSEELVACLKYALGLEYGGGVHFEGEEKPVGMLREVFVELCELIVPKWDRKNV